MTDEMNEYLTFLDFYHTVAREARGLGYTERMVTIFKSDIRECYDTGKSIEQTLEEVF